MSKQMIKSFFPAHCSHILEPFLPQAFEWFYPADVVETCPEPVITVVGLAIRRPFLAVFAMVGILTGLLGALRIGVNLTTTRRRNATTVSKKTPPLSHEARLYWMFAFLFFGAMNLNGLFLHCLVSPTRISALEQPLLWVGDTFTTGAFGLALWAAAMMECFPSIALPTTTTNWTTTDAIPVVWACGHLLGALAIGWFLVFGYDADSILPGTLPLECFYFGPPTTLAASGLLLLLIRKPFHCKLGLAMLLANGTFWVAAFDPWLCRQFANTYYDLLTTPTLMFLATDIVYLGIASWLMDEDATTANKDSHSKRVKQM